MYPKHPPKLRVSEIGTCARPINAPMCCLNEISVLLKLLPSVTTSTSASAPFFGSDEQTDQY
jgi:hypothetical protein